MIVGCYSWHLFHCYYSDFSVLLLLHRSSIWPSGQTLLSVRNIFVVDWPWLAATYLSICLSLLLTLFPCSTQGTAMGCSPSGEDCFSVGPPWAAVWISAPMWSSPRAAVTIYLFASQGSSQAAGGQPAFTRRRQGKHTRFKQYIDIYLHPFQWLNQPKYGFLSINLERVGVNCL